MKTTLYAYKIRYQDNALYGDTYNTVIVGHDMLSAIRAWADEKESADRRMAQLVESGVEKRPHDKWKPMSAEDYRAGVFCTESMGMVSNTLYLPEQLEGLFRDVFNKVTEIRKRGNI